MDEPVFDEESMNGGGSNLSSELNSNHCEMKCHFGEGPMGMDHLCHTTHNKDTSLSGRYCCDPLNPDPSKWHCSYILDFRYVVNNVIESDLNFAHFTDVASFSEDNLSKQ